MVDTEALLQRYRKEIDDLKRRLGEREEAAAEPRKGRRLSEREVRRIFVLRHTWGGDAEAFFCNSNLTNRKR